MRQKHWNGATSHIRLFPFLRCLPSIQLYVICFGLATSIWLQLKWHTFSIRHTNNEDIKETITNNKYMQRYKQNYSVYFAKWTLSLCKIEKKKIMILLFCYFPNWMSLNFNTNFGFVWFSNWKCTVNTVDFFFRFYFFCRFFLFTIQSNRKCVISIQSQFILDRKHIFTNNICYRKAEREHIDT